jgi:F-type H+-transporting ATPase subunit delta
MLVVKIAVPYAQALLELANATNSLKETTNDMINVTRLVVLPSNDDTSIKKALSNPLIFRDAKKGMLTEFNIKGEYNFSETTLTFLMLLVDRGRISHLEDIAHKFIELSYKEERLEIALVTSAIRLLPAQEELIALELKLLTSANKIRFGLRVDPELLGGFTIQIGSQLIDMSIRGQLKQVGKLLGAT